jgi:two-component system sensor kinase FixL
VRAADGSWFWVEGSPTQIRDDEGRLVGLLSVLRDITDRKAAELALREVNAELRRVARVSALGAFATSIAHEINQPLAAVVNYANSVRHRIEGVDLPTVRGALEYVDKAIVQAQRASKIVNNLRGFVERRQLTKMPASVANVFNDGLDLALTGSPGIIVERRIAHDLPVVPMQVRAGSLPGAK